MAVGDLEVARCGDRDIHIVISDAVLIIIDTTTGPFLVALIVVTVGAEDSARSHFGSEIALARFSVWMIVRPAGWDNHPLGRHGGG